MGDLVKTIRPKQTRIMYVITQNGKIQIFDRSSCITAVVNSNPQFKTIAKYLPIVIDHRTTPFTRTFKQPKRELFKNSEIFKF